MMSSSNMRSFILLGLSLLLMACKDELPTPFVEQQPAFSRNAGWRLDPISHDYPFFYLDRIWAAGPNVVYVAGSELFKFNGNSWQFIPMHHSVGGPITSTGYSFQDIYGFSGSDIWLVGAQLLNSFWFPLVLHYDGQAWTEVRTPAPYDARFSAVWGLHSGDLWLAGFSSGRPFILHYDGRTWMNEPLSYLPKAGDFSMVTSFAGFRDQNPFAMVVSIASTFPFEGYYLYQRRDLGWELVDSNASTYYRTRRLFMSSDRSLYSAGKHLSRWTGAEWIVMREGFDARSILNVCGSTDNNLLVVGASVWGGNGFVDHYNGSDWVTLPTGFPTSMGLIDAASNGSYIVALGSDANSHYYVLRSQ